MSYAILRMQKIKATGIKGMQFHNQRERESLTNPDIDYEKSYLNYDLVNDHLINFNKKVEQIIKANVKTDKKIRKDAVRMCDIVITSDPSFFKALADKEIDKFFKDSFEFLSNRYGKGNVVYSTVHLDESTPHMHFGVVPVTEDNRLSAKDIFNRQELRDLQTEYQKFITGKGFELARGVPSDKKGLSTQEFKKKLLQDDIKTKENVLSSLKNDLKALESDLNIKHIVKDDIKKINEIKASKPLFQKDKVVLSSLDYENLLEMAKWSVLGKEKELYPYKKMIYELKKENERLIERVNKKENMKDMLQWSKEKADIRNEISKKDKYIKDLEKFIIEKDLIDEFNKSKTKEKSFEIEL